MSNVDIAPEHLNIVLAILRKHLSQTASVWVFGSRSTRAKKQFSDLDLAIDYANHIIPQAILSDLAEDFDNSDLPYHVDIIDWNKISAQFKNNIDKTRVSLPGW